jgi:DNA processing protein
LGLKANRFPLAIEQQQSLIQSMQKNTKVHLDVIVLETKQKIGVVAVALMDLKMKGVVRALPGKYYELI